MNAGGHPSCSKTSYELSVCAEWLQSLFATAMTNLGTLQPSRNGALLFDPGSPHPSDTSELLEGSVTTTYSRKAASSYSGLLES